MKIVIACMGDSLEALTLRQSLELFGAEVSLRLIGRPNDLLEVLEGDSPADALILCGHGDGGAFLLPELGEEVYLPDEPRSLLKPDSIRAHLRRRNTLIVSTACTTGDPETADAFVSPENGNLYIAPADYVEGTAAYFFTVRLFYEMLCLGRSVKEACRNAASTDEECDLFRFCFCEGEGGCAGPSREFSEIFH